MEESERLLIPELMNKIRNHIGTKIYIKLKLLGSSFYVFDKNYQELNKIIEAYRQEDIAIELIGYDKDEALQLFHFEVGRLLHNYVSSVKSLVDHTRVTTNELYVGTDFMKEYQEEVKLVFGKSEVSNFIQDLRNFTIHKGLPITSASMTWNMISSTSTSVMNLNLQSLKEWDNWKSSSKVFISKQEKDLDLGMIVREYYDLVVNFYIWLNKRQNEIHSLDFAELELVKDDLRKVYAKLDFTIKQ